MITRRPSTDRGHADHGWLDSRHTFSFAGYHDPGHMGFRTLRVMNEDRVAGGKGFGQHGHRDMEIVSYVLSGALRHQDTMGNSSVLQAGHFQKMSAGSGIEHSEFNASATEPVHFYQMWILPTERGLRPDYFEADFSQAEHAEGFWLVAGPAQEQAQIVLHQDARLFLARLNAGPALQHLVHPDRHVWLQVTKGALKLNGIPLEAGDGAAISEEQHVQLETDATAEALLFDLA